MKAAFVAAGSTSPKAGGAIFRARPAARGARGVTRFTPSPPGPGVSSAALPRPRVECVGGATRRIGVVAGPGSARVTELTPERSGNRPFFLDTVRRRRQDWRVAIEQSAQFALRSGSTWDDPFPMYASLRAHDPVHHVADGDYWFVSKFADVWEASRDAATFSSASGLTVRYDETETLGMGEAVPMVFLDPPAHTEFRRLVTKPLTPRRVADIEDDVRAFVVDRIERARADGETDIVAALFKPLPSFVVAHYLGVPAEDRERFDGWSGAIVQAVAGGDPMKAGAAFADLLGYFSELVERRRREPADDLTSDLVALGEDTVSVARILGFAFTMVTGGNDTITGMLSGAACLLTEHRDQRAALVADPSLLEPAVEELLRLTSPVQNLARTVTRDVTIRGVTIPKGRKVLLGYGSANRDEDEFGPDAELFHVGRRPTRILTFSSGTHYCIGAAAARLQGRVAIEELLRRCPDFEVDVAGGRYADGNYVRRHDSLPWRAAG